MKIVILADPLDNQYAGIHIYTKEMIRSVTALDRENEYILIREKKRDDFPKLRQMDWLPGPSFFYYFSLDHTQIKTRPRY